MIFENIRLLIFAESNGKAHVASNKQANTIEADGKSHTSNSSIV